MEYLSVKNWRDFQHYKDRNPPWIKLHYEIMTSSDWVMLADASKLLAVVCMLIASRNNGMIPKDPSYFKRVAYLDKTPDFKPLLDCGFLEILQADASERKQVQAIARPETYRTEKERITPISPLNFPDEKFETFFSEFPTQRKGAKESARKAWQKAIIRSAPQEIISGMRKYKISDEVKKGFAKGAAAWLNDDRWKNDYSQVHSKDIENKTIEAPPTWY